MKRTVLAAVVLALVAAACGGGDSETTDQSGRGASRTVDIEMVELAFKPDTLTVEEGETVRFVFRNRGSLPHDAFIGDAAAQADHEQEMRQAEDGGDEGHGGMGEKAEGDAVTVAPGKTGELTYTFDQAGALEIGCHEPGHYAAGMKVSVTVA